MTYQQRKNQEKKGEEMIVQIVIGGIIAYIAYAIMFI